MTKYPCTTIPRPLCRPTPYMGPPCTTRIVHLKHCQIMTIMAQLSDDVQSFVFSRFKPEHDYPLTMAQAVHFLELLTATLPNPLPADCCTEIALLLTEDDLYLLSRWRYWLENWMACLLARTDTGTIGGAIVEKKLTGLYGKLTDIKRRLSPTPRP